MGREGSNMEIEVKSVLMEWGRGGWARRCFSRMPSCKATFGLALCRETSARAEGGGGGGGADFVQLFLGSRS